MKCPGSYRITLVMFFTSSVLSMPTKDNSTRRYATSTQISATLQQLTNQLMHVNTSTPDITFDTRTPPKVKQQMKKPIKHEVEVENSHPGIAVPVHDVDLLAEESTKKFNFYKVEVKPTTASGLSTWVLLNSQTVSPPITTKTTKKPKPKPSTSPEVRNQTNDEIFNKMVKPLFKKRPPTTTTSKTTSKPVTTTEETKFTKIKASVLTSAIHNKSKTDSATTTTTTMKKLQATTPSAVRKPSTITHVKSTTLPTFNSSVSVTMGLESKDGDLDLTVTTTANPKKTRRPTTKRKKNKNRKKKPSIDRSDTNVTETKIANKVKQKPIGTQLYNYLSREIMPTVGVGLVGLMVTAGLASYFLYPFSPVRRKFEVDRRDKNGAYYYNDEYATGGMAEEEVIGKVVAGMPINSNDLKGPTSRDAYSTSRLRKTPYRAPDEVLITPASVYNQIIDTYVPQSNHYPSSSEKPSVEPSYHDQRQFVVGNIPKELNEVITPMVPEHGPRAMSRKRRDANEIDNEILDETSNHIVTPKVEIPVRKEVEAGISKITEIPSPPSSTTTTKPSHPMTFMETITHLFQVKIRLGVELLKNLTGELSRYFSEVQKRLDDKGKEQPRK